MMNLADRLASYTIPDDDGCWRFTGSHNPKGYGMCGYAAGYSALAHRRAYQLAYGEVPEGLDVHHTCHVRDCVNPEHLQAVTHKKNTQERLGADMRSLTGSRNVSLVDGRFRVVVKHDGRNHWGGSFDTLEQAEARAAELRRSVFDS